MGPISKNQTLVSLAAIVSLTVAVCLHVVDSSVYLGIMSAMLGNAVGYINGKKNGSTDGGTPSK